MSRINTQDDRLVRGPDAFQVRTNVESVRIAPARKDTIRQLISSVNQAAGAVAGVVETQNKQRNKIEKEDRAEQFNKAQSDLSLLQDKLTNDPTFDSTEYITAYNSYLNVFGDETTEGVTLRTKFASQPEVTSLLKSRDEERDTSIQGAYLLSAEDQVINYDTEENRQRLSLLESPMARDVVFKEMLETYSEEDLGNLTPETLRGIKALAEDAINPSRARHKEQVKAGRDTVIAYAKASIVSDQITSGQLDINRILEYASTSNISDKDAITDFANSFIANHSKALQAGSPEQIDKSVTLLNDLNESLAGFPDVQDLITSEIASNLRFHAEKVSVTMEGVAVQSFTELDTEAKASALVNATGILAMEDLFGIDIPDSTTQLQDYATQNKSEEIYKDALLSSISQSMSRFEARSTTLDSANQTIADPNNASVSDIREVVNLDGEEQVAFIEERLDVLLKIPTPHDEDTTAVIDLLIDAQSGDSAAWSEYIGRTLKDTLHFSTARDVIMGDLLSPENVTSAGVRQALAFTGGNLDVISKTMTNPAQVYALSKTRAGATDNPEIDLGTEYTRHVDDYNSQLFDVKGPDDVPLFDALDDPKVAERLTGVKGATITPDSKRKMLTILDVTTLDSSKPSDIVGSRVRQQLRENGLTMSPRQVGEEVLINLSSSRAIPEYTYSDTSTLFDSMNDNTTPMNRAMGQFIDPGAGRTLFDIGLTAIRNPAILKDVGLEELTSVAGIQKHVDAGNITFGVDSLQATGELAPIVMTFVGKDGVRSRPVILGWVNFDTNFFRNSPPSFYESTRPAQSLKNPAFKVGGVEVFAPVRTF